MQFEYCPEALDDDTLFQQRSVDYEKVLILFGHNRKKEVSHFDFMKNEIVELLTFPQNESKMDYTLCLAEDSKHIFVIGGTTVDALHYSTNYFLTPTYEMDKSTGTQMSDATDTQSLMLKLDYTKIPDLNFNRSRCSVIIHNGFLFVFFGQGMVNDKKGKSTHASYALDNIEYASVKDLLACKDDIYVEKNSTMFKCLDLQTKPNEIERIFFCPMIFEN